MKETVDRSQGEETKSNERVERDEVVEEALNVRIGEEKETT